MRYASSAPLLAAREPAAVQALTRAAPVSEHGQGLWFASFILVFGFAWPLWLTSGVTRAETATGAAVLLQVMLLLYASTRLAYIFALARPDWLQITLWTFVYTWFGVAPLVQVVAGRTPLRQTLHEDVAVVQVLIVGAGLAAYDIGRLIANSHQVSGTSTIGFRALSRGRVLLLSGLAVLVTPIAVQLMGGLEALFNSREARMVVLQGAGFYTEASKSSGAVLTAASSIIPFLGLYCLWFLRDSFHGPSGRLRAGVAGLLLVLIVSNLVLNNPISSSRFWVLTVLLSFFFAAARFQGKTGVRLIVVGFLVASIAVFPYLDAFRYEKVTLTRQSAAHFFLTKTDYDAMAQVGNAWRYTQEYGHTWGQQMLGAAFFWVPRSVWPDKAIDSGSLLARFIHYPNENLSGPFWSELFLDFGWVGVILGFAIVGFASGRLSSRYLTEVLRPRAQDTVLVAAFPVFAMYQVLILRGSLLQAMGRLAVIVLVFWVLTTLRNRRGIS